ncbi:hypothetical protein PLCT2_01133 [Planctomycetaceae bacterium]|nr:hypothetical protein PLCT2_01133 [Planctomycetaceae bacterium]
MATNLDLDPALVEEALRAGKHKSKKEAVTAALVEYIKLKKRLGILDLIGKVDYYDDYDIKKLRQKKANRV